MGQRSGRESLRQRAEPRPAKAVLSPKPAGQEIWVPPPDLSLQSWGHTRIPWAVAWGRTGTHPGQMLRSGQHPKGRWVLVPAGQDLFLPLIVVPFSEGRPSCHPPLDETLPF